VVCHARTVKRFLRNRIAAWARRRQGLDVPPFTFHSRRIYILPTRLGVSFGVMLVVMLIAGLNYGNSAALFLTFLLGGFALVSMHQCHRNLLRAKFVSAAASPFFAGVNGRLRVTLANEERFVRYGIEVAVPDSAGASADIAVNGQAHVDVVLPPSKRGVLRIDRLHVSTSFPYNLFRAWTWVHMPIEVVVYPRAQGSIPMPMESGEKAGTRAMAIAGSDEWLGLRPFRDGDSPRQVAWKAYARGAPLLVKEYSALGAELRLFEFSKLPQLETEARLEQLARWVVEAESRGERYGLVLPGHRFGADSGPQHRHECLEALALYGLPRDALPGHDSDTPSPMRDEPSRSRSPDGVGASLQQRARDAR
jgi:uncharacterized protein (DUF58 family)